MESETLSILSTIIGGLIGIATAFMMILVNHLLMNKGQLKITPKTLYSSYKEVKTQNGYTTLTVANDISQSKFLCIEFSLDLYNESRTNRVMRDIQVLFYENQKKIAIHKLTEKIEFFEGYKIKSKIEHIRSLTVAPKEAQFITCILLLNNENMNIVHNFDEVQVAYTDYKGERQHFSLEAKNILNDSKT